MKLFVINSLLFLCIGPVLAQQKFEKEYRIEATDVSPLARQFVDSLDFGRRVGWYREISQQGESIEAKSKRGGQKYSVEFGLAGELQDVEIEIAWRSLSDDIQRNIEQSLNADFEKFKIRKVQRQFSGQGEEVLNQINHPSQGNNVTTKYELVLKGRKDGETNEFEYTFSANGILEKKAKMNFRNTDNLEY